MSNHLRWSIEHVTAEAALKYPLPIKRQTPAPQFEGFSTDSKIWDDRVVQPADWPGGPLKSSPHQIIEFFGSKRYTQGLAMVVSWGGMARRSKDIYGSRRSETIKTIERTLQACADSIQTSHSIADSWQALTGELKWSAVITSKTLHFLCRSLGFNQNPPAAIDGRCIRDHVWPAFQKSIPVAELPEGWQGNGFDAYCRYMTAIITWAESKNWTTTEMESTIFCEYL